MITAGSSFTFELTGQRSGWWLADADDIRTDVVSWLSQYFIVSNVSIEPGSVTERLGLQWPYTARVSLTLRSDYGTVNDVASIVAHAFYQAAGTLPTVTAGIGSQGPGVDRGAGGSLIDPLRDLFSGVQQTTTLVIVALVVIVGLVAFGPSTRGIGKIRVSAT